MAALTSRIDALEKSIKSIGTGQVSKSGDIVIQSDYQSSFPTVGVGNFDVSLMQCSRNGNRATCQFLFKNNDNNDREFLIYANHNTRVILPSGLPIKASRVTLGTSNSTRNVKYRFPPQIPTRVDLSFEGIDRDAKGFLILQVGAGHGVAEFKNVELK